MVRKNFVIENKRGDEEVFLHEGNSTSSVKEEEETKG